MHEHVNCMSMRWQEYCGRGSAGTFFSLLAQEILLRRGDFFQSYPPRRGGASARITSMGNGWGGLFPAFFLQVALEVFWADGVEEPAEL
nr:hypothetical protein [Bacillota bacterium]